jgi:hypothetical protein
MPLRPIFACVLLVAAASHADAVSLSIPAFPGAEGFGARATGGRGGDVYHVTNIDDSGPGSLRYGIENATGPRTIVFSVSGTIVLKSHLTIRKPNITIAGQTAPGDGICLRDYSVLIRNTHDIIVRHIRLRRGDVQVRAAGVRPTGSTGLDVVSIDDSQNIIFDHVSLSWSCDEVFGIVQNENVTIQWCIISEPLGDPLLHPYGNNHAYGLNNSANTMSVHHNLIANYVMRGPQFEANDADSSQGYDVLMEAVNNVVFDYKSSGSRYTAGIEENPAKALGLKFQFHFVNNYYIRGWNTAPEIQATTKWGVTDQLKVYVSGNLGPNRPRNDLDNWASVTLENGPPIRQAEASVRAQMSDAPLFTAPFPVVTQSADAAYTSVLQYAGASIARDSVDRRIIGNVIARRFSDYLQSQDQVGGWFPLNSTPAPTDSDFDGMPDTWEHACALNPSDAADGNADRDGDGYTNLEEYLNSLVGEVYPNDVRREDTSGSLTPSLRAVPNPFNPATDIRFVAGGRVQLAVFNVAGQRVRALVDSTLTPGHHTARWDGMDDGGQPAASGIYIVRLVAGDATLATRVTLVR